MRVTLGVDADTHEAIRTGHHGSKFGLPPDQARALVADALDRGLDVLGVHVHVGSQLADFDAQAETIVRLAAFAARCRDDLGWVAQVADLGGGFGIRHHPDDDVPDAASSPRARRRPRGSRSSRRACRSRRSGSSRAAASSAAPGVTLYRVGSVKRLPGRTWVAIDGGMSDNPRPQLYDARYTALSAARADEPPDEVVSVAGMHCESGDVLIDDVALPSPRRGDLLAVPATGAYTLAMASNYNGVDAAGGGARPGRRGAGHPPPRDDRRPAPTRAHMSSELRTAAVLLPVFRDADGDLRIVLVVRADDGGLHGGQLGLPGGKPEPGDADLLATALREAEEEVGLPRETVEVVAVLAAARDATRPGGASIRSSDASPPTRRGGFRRRRSSGSSHRPRAHSPTPTRGAGCPSPRSGSPSR